MGTRVRQAEHTLPIGQQVNGGVGSDFVQQPGVRKVYVRELGGYGANEIVERGARLLRPRAAAREQRVNLVPVGVAIDRLDHRQEVVKLTVPRVVICVACTVTSATGEVSS